MSRAAFDTADILRSRPAHRHRRFASSSADSSRAIAATIDAKAGALPKWRPCALARLHCVWCHASKWRAKSPANRVVDLALADEMLPHSTQIVAARPRLRLKPPGG